MTTASTNFGLNTILYIYISYIPMCVLRHHRDNVICEVLHRDYIARKLRSNKKRRSNDTHHSFFPFIPYMCKLMICAGTEVVVGFRL